MEAEIRNIPELDDQQLAAIESIDADLSGAPALLKENRLGFAARALLVGMAVGSALGIYEARGTNVLVLPGVEAQASPAFNRGATLSLGPLGDVYFPHLSTNEPVIGKISGHVSINRANLSPQNLNELAAAISKPEDIIVKPLDKQIKDHFEADLINGLAGGALAGGAITGFRELKRRRKNRILKHEMDVLDEYEAEVGAVTISEMKAKLLAAKNRTGHEIQNRRRKLAGAVGLTAALLTLSGATAHGQINNSHSAFEAIDPSLTAGIGFLDGAEVTSGSPLSQLINVALPQVLSLKDTIDQSYQGVVPGLKQAVNTWEYRPANQSWLNSSEYDMALVNSNLHCDIPYETDVLPALTSSLAPRLSLIINNGDTMISSGAIPFEEECVNIQAKALQAAVNSGGSKIMEVTIKGEDDSPSIANQQQSLIINGPDGKTYQPIIDLNKANNYMAKIDGITFVGGPDPRQHISGVDQMQINGKPADQQQQDAALLDSGKTLAKEACHIQQTAGLSPIMIVHNDEQAVPAEKNSCIGAVLSSEGNWHNGVQINTSGSGTSIVSLVMGTSSGADWNGFAPYSQRAHDAPSEILFIDKYTNQIAGYSQLILDKSGNTTISDVKAVPAN